HPRHRSLHSFPTRRSSDLAQRARAARRTEEAAERGRRCHGGVGFRGSAEKENRRGGGENHSAQVQERRRPSELSDPGDEPADGLAGHGGKRRYRTYGAVLRGFRRAKREIGDTIDRLARGPSEGSHGPE